jgi:hypothetical protein
MDGKAPSPAGDALDLGLGERDVAVHVGGKFRESDTNNIARKPESPQKLSVGDFFVTAQCVAAAAGIAHVHRDVDNLDRQRRLADVDDQVEHQVEHRQLGGSA